MEAEEEEEDRDRKKKLWVHGVATLLVATVVGVVPRIGTNRGEYIQVVCT